MRAGGAPTPLDSAAWAGGRLRGARGLGRGKAQARSTPADASVGGLEGSPRFTPRAWLLQWGAPHPHPPTSVACQPRFQPVSTGRRGTGVLGNLPLGLRAPGLSETPASRSLSGLCPSAHSCEVGCAPGVLHPALLFGVTLALAVNRLTSPLQDCEERTRHPLSFLGLAPAPSLPSATRRQAPPRWRPVRDLRPRACSGHVLPAPRAVGCRVRAGGSPCPAAQDPTCKRFPFPVFLPPVATVSPPPLAQSWGWLPVYPDCVQNNTVMPLVG